MHAATPGCSRARSFSPVDAWRVGNRQAQNRVAFNCFVQQAHCLPQTLQLRRNRAGGGDDRFWHEYTNHTQMRRRNPKRDPSKPYVYFGLTSLPVDRRFDFRRATPEHEWRLHKFGVRLMPELYNSLHPMMRCEQALQTAKKLADDLRAKGFGVANAVCSEAQSYKSILTTPKNLRDDQSGLRDSSAQR